MVRCLVALVFLIPWFAIPAGHAVTLRFNDLVVIGDDPSGNFPGQLVHIDHATGNRTAFACVAEGCLGAGLPGTGPVFVGISPPDVFEIFISNSGTVILTGRVRFNSSQFSAVIEVDPATGDRSFLSLECGTSGLCDNDPVQHEIGSGPRFSVHDGAIAQVPLSLSAFPSWGAPLLGGILVGLALRLKAAQRWRS